MSEIGDVLMALLLGLLSYPVWLWMAKRVMVREKQMISEMTHIDPEPKKVRIKKETKANGQ